MSKKAISTAKEVVENFGKVQRRTKFNYPCPRCGHYTMDGELVRNALSRRADVYICDQCGTNEAMCDCLGIDDNLDDWSLVVSLRA